MTLNGNSAFADEISRWGPSPLWPSLQAEDVHVWLANLNQPDSVVGRLFSTLNKDERHQAGRFHFNGHRVHYIASHGILREILGRYLRIPPQGIRFSFGVKGKPSIDADNSDETVHFNMAHSGSYAFYAISRRPKTGADIEKVREIIDRDQIVSRNFSMLEVDAYQNLPYELQEEAFFNGWTRKEAYIKAIGDGLHKPLEQFSVTITPGEPARLVNIVGDPESAPQWTLQGFNELSGYVAAIAVKGVIRKLERWMWQISRSEEVGFLSR
jgi:4'-phosphopantetheinyl transferase